MEPESATSAELLAAQRTIAALQDRVASLEDAAVRAHAEVQAQAAAAAAQAQQAQGDAHMARAQAHVAQAQSANGQTQSSSGPKPLKPSTFTGHLNEDPAEWTFQISQYLDACWMPEERKVSYVASFLRDNALTWWRAHIQAAERGAVARIVAWPDFTAALLAHFQRPNLQKVLRDKLAGLRQHRSVHEYTAQLQTLAVQITDLSEGELMDRFIRGLKPAIRKEVELRDPANIQEAIRLAERTDSVEYRMRGTGFSGNRHAFRSANPSGNGPVPMELGAIEGPKTTGYRDQQRLQRDYSNVTCWSCGEKGHPKRLCKKKTGNGRRQ